MDALDLILWPIQWVHDEPQHALWVATALLLHYITLRTMARQGTMTSTDVLNALAIGLWVAFWPYEIQMSQWEKTVKVPIRIDLLFVAILLYGMTVASIVTSWALLLAKSK